MKSVSETLKIVLSAFLLLFAMLCAGGCAKTTLNVSGPPVLNQDELLRPFSKVGVIEVRRSRYGDRSDFSSEDYNWAHDALRAEAAKINADAVIYPEVSVEVHRYLFFPKSEMKAKGTAIKFR